MGITRGHQVQSLLAGALAGVLSAAAGLATGELVAALLSADSPVVAVGQRAIDLAPPFAKDFAVSTFGTSDKTVLVSGVLAVVALVAAVAGAVGVRHRLVGLGAAGVVGLLALGAALTGPRVAGVVATVVPATVATVVSVVALALLLGRVAGRRQPAPPPAEVVMAGGSHAAEPVPQTMRATRMPGDELPPTFDRRGFLVTALAVGAVTATAGAATRLVGPSGASRDGITIPRPADPAMALPKGVDVGVPGVTPYVTTNGDFYRVDTLLTVPRIDASTWKLRVHGMVERELELDFAQLLSRPLVERYVTLTCVSNEVGGPYVGNAAWIGVPIADVLKEAGVLGGADAVKSTSTDGMTIGTPVQALTDGRDALLAVAMNGKPLPFEHGFPVRMVVPGLYGYVSATKWVTDLEVTRFADFDAYWTSRGYAAQAPIKTSSRIDVPKGFAQLKPGRVPVAGVAWAQDRGIENVQVRVDAGEWQEATLAKTVSIDTWRQWRLDWDATPGQHRLEVRATDDTGEVQTGDRAPIRPDGTTGWHSVAVTVLDS